MKIEELDLEKAKEIIASWAKGRDFISRVHLFGSRLSGYSKKTGEPVRLDSDLDIAIEFDHSLGGEECFQMWMVDSDEWKEELLKLLEFEKTEYLDLQWYHPDMTEHVHQYLKDDSIVCFNRIGEANVK